MSSTTSGLYEFGPYRFDVAGRLFTRDSHIVPLAPKTFELLLLLVGSPGRAFSKRELMNALWPDTFVEEANLSFQISALRKALGDDGALIETVPKHGYRFAADVRAVAAVGLAAPVAEADAAAGVKFGARTKWDLSRSARPRCSLSHGGSLSDERPQ